MHFNAGGNTSWRALRQLEIVTFAARSSPSHFLRPIGFTSTVSAASSFAPMSPTLTAWMLGRM